MFITEYAKLATGRLALDIACGMGRNSKYLASIGFEVDALDISSVAIDTLRDTPHIHPKEVDFDHYVLPQNLHLREYWDKDGQGNKIMKTSMIAKKKTRKQDYPNSPSSSSSVHSSSVSSDIRS